MKYEESLEATYTHRADGTKDWIGNKPVKSEASPGESEQGNSVVYDCIQVGLPSPFAQGGKRLALVLRRNHLFKGGVSKLE
jgi:hypothetical protein